MLIRSSRKIMSGPGTVLFFTILKDLLHYSCRCRNCSIWALVGGHLGLAIGESWLFINGSLHHFARLTEAGSCLRFLYLHADVSAPGGGG